MRKPIREYHFRIIDGMWRDIDTAEILADVLLEHDLLIDDRTQFARMPDYDRGVNYWFRHWGGNITLTLWKI